MKKKAVAAKKSAKATPADAEVLLRLYDFRREATMRDARNYMAFQFNPQSVEDMVKVAGGYGSPENAYFRQVTSYWDMAAALALHGAVNRELFERVSGEMFFIWSKMEPYAERFRIAHGSPTFMSNVQQLVDSSEYGRERVRKAQENQKRAAQRAASGKQ